MIKFLGADVCSLAYKSMNANASSHDGDKRQALTPRMRCIACRPHSSVTRSVPRLTLSPSPGLSDQNASDDNIVNAPSVRNA